MKGDEKMVFETVCEVLCEQLGIDKDEITMESDIVEDLGAESIDVWDLAASIQEEYGIELTDEDLESFRTVGDAVHFIEEHQ